MNNNICDRLPLGRSLAILAKTYYGALTKRLEHLEIERYYSILILIEGNGNECTQQFICDELKMDKVSMVRIIDYLIEKKYVKKVVNPHDRREHFVQLTSKAIKNLPAIHEAIDEVNAAALKGIGKEKQRELYQSLNTIQRNLAHLPAQKIFINYKKSNKKL
ncbi:MAG TPA: MarR family winged helix-turn-helix transcriptional regulator [Bacteroidia bacterium]|nr:MarR family winged helix-turn-helix transcriptional regulator [Bacteroidia bacterium]